MNEKKKFRSRILEFFDPELIAKFEVIALLSRLDNNGRANMIKKLMTEYNIPWSSLGTGTNRVGVKIDGYVFKIALDQMGMIDNTREFKYSKVLQPYVIEVYDCLKNGIIAVSEYVTPFGEDDYYDHMPEVREILKDISSQYLIGDIGLTTNNYGNWGIVNPDGIIKCLDFAYIYSFGYQTFQCSCGELLVYDDAFVNLYCPNCNKKYTFREVRRRITRDDEAAEIGNIEDYSYTVHGAVEELEIDPKLTEIKTDKKNKKKKMSEPSSKNDGISQTFEMSEEDFKKFKEEML